MKMAQQTLRISLLYARSYHSIIARSDIVNSYESLIRDIRTAESGQYRDLYKAPIAKDLYN